MLNVSIIISDSEHPIYSIVNEWCAAQTTINALLVNKVSELSGGGDFLFLVSCSELVAKDTRDMYKYCLVLHASDLPKGRGWSPHIWDIINGNNFITLSLLEAKDKVDSGNIWLKEKILLDGTELFDEINSKLFTAEVLLIEKALRDYKNIVPTPQNMNVTPSYYRKRTPEDSKINPLESIASQLNLMRTCDSNRFPAFFDLNGQRYTIKLEKIGKVSEK